MAKKIKLSLIKELVKSGLAKDLEKMKNAPDSGDLRTEAISLGVYGMNGTLFKDKKETICEHRYCLNTYKIKEIPNRYLWEIACNEKNKHLLCI